MNMTRRIAGFIFWRECEVADIGPVLNLLWLVERQHVQRGIALHQLFHVVLQQRTDNDARPVLLYLRQHLVKRLRAGVVDFQFSARVGAGGCHGLRLRGRLSRGLCRLLLRLFCCCGRSWCRLRLGRSLGRRCCCSRCSFSWRRRRGRHRVLHRALRWRLRRGQVAGLCGGWADNIIIHISRLGCLCGNGAAGYRRRAVFRRFKTLLNGTSKHRRLAVERQKQGDFAGGSWLKVLHVHQLGWQHFRARVLRVARLPVRNAGFQHFWIAAVVKPHLLQIQPALQDVFIGVDDQRLRLFLRHRRQRLPGGINIFLLISTAKQRLLRDERAEQGQRRASLLSGNTRLPEARLLVFIQRAYVDITEDLLRRGVIFQRDFQLGREQALLATLCVVKIFWQLVKQFGCPLGFTLFQQCTNGE